MDYRNLIETVRTEYEHQPSVEDQARVIILVGKCGYAESQTLLQSEIKEFVEEKNIEFDCADAGAVITNLLSIGILQRSRPSGDRIYVISERRNEIINGEFQETLHTDCEAFTDHIIV
ncbi:hypothetical protein ACOZ4F_07045 [Haloarcula marismortui]|uniref:hypothetical protein n=1 Tax=Haloarcula marismortui TaxID=2238 RepID=UPI003C7654DC